MRFDGCWCPSARPLANPCKGELARVGSAIWRYSTHYHPDVVQVVPHISTNTISSLLTLAYFHTLIV